MPLPLLARWAASAQVVLAADAGLDRLLEAGYSPDAVVGDLDSTQMREALPSEKVRQELSEEESDCDKLLRLAELEGFEEITLASVEGDQLDHMLGTLHSAARSSLTVRLALRTGIGWVLNQGVRLVVPTVPGRRVSLVPLEEVGGACLSGVHWPLAGAELHPMGRTGVSNRATEEAVCASLEKGSAFLFVGFPQEEMPLWGV
jgi:thiamine pyrophosphokinase